MRLSLYRLVVASVITCATVYLIAAALHLHLHLQLPLPHASSSAQAEREQQTPAAEHHDDQLARTQQFWRPWAKVFSNARPRAPPIDVAANNHAPDTSAPWDTTRANREPPQQHIKIPDDTIVALRDAHRDVIEALQDADAALFATKDLFRGAGVVTVAGGEYFGPAVVGIRMLRAAGSTLPVDVFLAGEHEYEQEVCEVVLPKLNAQCLLLTDFMAGDNAKFEITHFQLKSLAMLFSRFQHVLFMDSDSIPLVDPDDLFTREPYVSTGLVGWPDFWMATEAPIFYAIAGLVDGMPTNLPLTSTEAGQILVNKAKHLGTLLLAAYYNIWGPEWYYPLLSQGSLGQGDKNTFETAAIVLGAPWYRVRTAVRALTRVTGQEVKGSAMVQADPRLDYLKYEENEDVTVAPAFIHANTPKMNAGHLVDEGDLQDTKTSKHLRLWGPAHELLKMFDEDVELKTWVVVRDVGCELAGVIKEWKGRQDMCQRLKTHWDAVFAS